MRWKLLRRRLSISAPRMIVRSHASWPMRWASRALVLGFSAALALWAFEAGRSIAGLDRDHAPALDATAFDQMRSERDKAQSIANTAQSLLTAERTAQERLAGQVRELEAQNLALKRDLGFFERLLPTSGKGSVVVRGAQAEVVSAGQLHYQLLVMQKGRSPAEFKGRYELSLHGRMGGKAWSQAAPQSQPLQFRQYQRIDAMLEFPEPALVDTVQVRVVDAQGSVRASEDIHL